MKPIFFSSQHDFRTWLEANHDRADELLVGYWKVGTGKASMTWSESVDQALCFGWIDGIRRRIDDESYSIRFTPRRPKSIWSRINIDKVEQLKKDGLMTPAGLAAYEKKDEKRSEIYAYENRPDSFPLELERVFKKKKKAWTFFISTPVSYRRNVIHWVSTAKQEATRIKRLEKVMELSAEGKRVY
jgi:uncharacterized protein YdeI (YjbR/CyaY-like superfamily)